LYKAFKKKTKKQQPLLTNFFRPSLKNLDGRNYYFSPNGIASHLFTFFPEKTLFFYLPKKEKVVNIKNISKCFFKNPDESPSDELMEGRCAYIR
jgi:hypothetical protein